MYKNKVVGIENGEPIGYAKRAGRVQPRNPPGYLAHYLETPAREGYDCSYKYGRFLNEKAHERETKIERKIRAKERLVEH